MSSILKGLIDEGENVAVIYVDGKPAAKYTKKHEAEDDAERIRKKYPNKKIEVKQEVREAEGDTLHDPEYALPEARRITKAIKYDDTVGDIVTQIQMLAERTEGIDSKTLEYSIDRVLSAKNSLESEVYGLEEAFEDAARNAQYKRDDVDEGNYNNNRTGFRRGPRDDERHDLDVQKPSNQVWGLKINGKVWSKDGKDVTFASKEQALKARQTLLAKRPELEIGLITKGGVAEDSLDEACWKGYHKEGNKELFGKTVPNCVKNEGVTEEKKKHHFIYEGIWDNIKNIYKGLSTAKPKYVRPTQKIGELDSEFQQRVTDAWNKYQAELGNPTEEPAQFGSNEMGHGSEDNELRMFMAGQKPAAIISRDQLPKWKKLIDSRKYATAQLTQHGRPSSVIIAQPGEEHRIEKLQQLVQNAIDAGEKGDFRAYQNSNYHRWVGKLLGYSADKINSFIQHYFKDTPDLAKKPVYEGMPVDNDMGSTPSGAKMTLGQWKQMWQKKMPNADMSLFRFPPNMQGSAIAYFDGWINNPDARWDPQQGIAEEQDACYRKVKSRYKVWPSAYASGALVQCRKKGASNWGNSTKNEDIMDQVDESLRDWFKEKWVRFGPDGKIRGDCARGDDSEGKPKCLPQSKAHSLGKKGRASAATRKRKEDPNPERSGKAINVNTKKKSNESMMESESSDAVYNAVLNRIMRRHLDVLQEYGPTIVMYAIEDVANGVGDLEEIGSSDVSIWTKQVINDLQSGQYAHLKETPTDLPVEGQPNGRRIYRPKSAGTFAEDTAYAGGMGQGGNAGQSYRKFKPKSAGTFKESAIMAGLKKNDEFLNEGLMQNIGAAALAAALAFGASTKANAEPILVYQDTAGSYHAALSPQDIPNDAVRKLVVDTDDDSVAILKGNSKIPINLPPNIVNNIKQKAGIGIAQPIAMKGSEKSSSAATQQSKVEPSKVAPTTQQNLKPGVVFQNNDWEAIYNKDAMSDESSCTIFSKSNRHIQVNVEANGSGKIYSSLKGRGGVQTYKYRFDSDPATGMKFPTSTEKQIGAVSVPLKEANGHQKLVIQTFTVLSDIVTDTINLQTLEPGVSKCIQVMNQK